MKKNSVALRMASIKFAASRYLQPGAYLPEYVQKQVSMLAILEIWWIRKELGSSTESYVSVDYLCFCTGLTKPVVRTVLASLLERGYVEFLPEDRGEEVAITGKGRAAILERVLEREGFSTRTSTLLTILHLLSGPIALVVSLVALLKAC